MANPFKITTKRKVVSTLGRAPIIPQRGTGLNSGHTAKANVPAVRYPLQRQKG